MSYRFGFNGMEKINEQYGEGNAYDFGARMLDVRIGRWLACDIMESKYPSYSPYEFAHNSPLKFVDPDGTEVIATDEKSKQNIKSTLTKQEAKFVRFNTDGTLDTKRLNKYKGKSDNITALKTLANSDIKYKFKVAGKDDSGDAFFEGTKEYPNNNYRGVTEVPEAASNPSPDKDVWIVVGNVSSDQEQTITTAHEAYGHAYFYDLQQTTDPSINYNHTFISKGESVWDEQEKMNVYQTTKVPTNTKLEKQIKKVENESKHNYNKQNKSKKNKN